MDSLPSNLPLIIILSIISLAAFCALLSILIMETSLSASLLSEKTLEESRTLKEKTRCRILWILNHPQTTAHALIAMRVALGTIASFSVCAALLILTNVDLLKSGIAALGVWVIVNLITALVLQQSKKTSTDRFAKSSWLTYHIARAYGLFVPTNKAKITDNNRYALSTREIEGTRDSTKASNERDILKGVLHFGEETVAEVMIPRVDVVDLSIHDDFATVIKCVIENNYSRIPVRDGVQDKIKGVLYVKDLLPYCNEANDFNWQRLIRRPFFVPESKMIDDLLREFQKNKIHIAIVIDEYGITSGIVTMEDILEEIVGEINDEYDEEERHYIRLDENIYIFEGKIPITDFFEVLNLNEEDYSKEVGEAETLAGFILELMDEFPVRHQTATCRDLTFEVLALDKRRITKVRVTVAKEKKEDASAQQA